MAYSFNDFAHVESRVKYDLGLHVGYPLLDAFVGELVVLEPNLDVFFALIRLK